MALVNNTNGFHPNFLLVLEQRHNDARDQGKDGASVVKVFVFSSTFAQHIQNLS